MNDKILLNDGWEFAKSSLETANTDSLEFKPVDLPHDWLIYNTLDLYENSIGWYRRHYTYNTQAKHVLLYFEGVYMDSTLYVNGKMVGEWKYGYSSFEHEITQALVTGENEILMKVVHHSPNSRWYSGAGIYRSVWLKTRQSSYIVTDSIYVSPRQTRNGWEVEIDTEMNLCNEVKLSHTLWYGDEIVASEKSTIAVNASEGAYFQIGLGETHQTSAARTNHRCTLTLDSPLLWSIEKPNLYRLTTELYSIENHQTEKIECISQNIGFRTIVLDPDKGLELNGKKIKLNGVCEHHDLGALGAAFNKTALRRRFEILQEMGVNAVRTAHNMPAPELMDLADEMGMLVMTEAFDMWERPKTTYDYARFFRQWAHRDIKSWVMRDRNHPSLFLWSIGNEIYDTHADDRGQEITRMLRDYVLEFDPKNNATITIGSNYMPWENARKCADILKIAGYNYAEKYYQKHHEENPDWVIYGSETSSVVQSRGVYHFPYEKSILADEDEQCSSLGNSQVSWGAKSPEACIAAERDADFSLGQFLWTGFDYIGEPTPYHTKNSYFGQIDTATFKKDPFFIYQAAWTDYKVSPMVHIFPYWDFNPGQIIDVRVISNAPKVELQLNGTTVGTHDIDFSQGTQFFGWWKIPFEKGELKAIAYDETGRMIATCIRKSFGEAKRICLKADKERLIANGTDLIFVEISAEDGNGNPVENANNRVQVEVSGAGRLIGLDNGDSTDYDQYKGLSRRLFSGKLMAIIAATKKAGEICMKVNSVGLESRTLTFEAIPAPENELAGVYCLIKNENMPCVMGSFEEIPLRKIELSSDSGQVFSASKRQIIVKARLHPENTSYCEVEWSAVNDTGIISNIAKVEASGLEAKVTALGDGEFRLRCTSKNGSDKVKLISSLEFKADGIGIAYKDPYSFITGGLYDYSKGEVGNGNEKGVATGRDGETHVGFRNLDFGSYGSDIITIPIFALNDDEYPLQIWEGMPGEEGSYLLADVIYQRPSIWNVYQQATWRLSKRLYGITSICFVLNNKVHIKGFSFERQSRAFIRNLVAQSDSIYGDSYTIHEDKVEGIGNNVSLEYENMDFGEEGASRLVICGCSPIERNTIQIRFASKDGSVNQLVEFLKSDGYAEREFELEKITGNRKVTFLFLPGSDFDFAWFRFER